MTRDTLLKGSECNVYKSVAGKALWIAFLRADFQFALVRCVRCWREPSTRDWSRIACDTRYLHWTPDTRV